MKTLSAGSAKRQSNANTSTPATIAAMEPRPSPTMCRKAARTFRSERDDRSSSAPAITLAVSPPDATMETMPPRTSGGAPSRCAGLRDDRHRHDQQRRAIDQRSDHLGAHEPEAA